MLVGKRISLDVWVVNGWQKDLAKLNEVFNVMMETNDQGSDGTCNTHLHCSLEQWYLKYTFQDPMAS